MNEKAIFEIGNIIHVRYKGTLNPFELIFGEKVRLTPEEITESVDYKWFKEDNPELCKLAEEDT